MIHFNMIYGLPKVASSDVVCEGYILEKHHHEKFEKDKAWRESHGWKLCTMNFPSLVGAKCILTFIGYLLMHACVDLLKTKNMVLDMFIESKTLTKKVMCAICELFKVWWRRWLCESALNNTFFQNGMLCHQIVVYSPHNSGILEWKNKKLIDMARGKLHAKGLPNKFRQKMWLVLNNELPPRMWVME